MKKQKITETVKESKTVKTIGTAVDRGKAEGGSLQNAHPAVQKVADAFRGKQKRQQAIWQGKCQA